MSSSMAQRILLGSLAAAVPLTYVFNSKNTTTSNAKPLLSTSQALASATSLASPKESLPGLEELTPEERAKNIKQFMRCEQMKQHALGSRKVRYMFNALAEMGNVVLEPEKFVQCMHCDVPLNAFALIHPKTTAMIGVCQNFLTEQTTLTDALTHELVHVYDNVRAHMDVRNCVHVACSEVRAAMLSGECSREKEVMRGVIPIGITDPGHFQKCVRRRARNSVLSQQHCNDPKVCDEALDLAFDRCFQDRAPFYAIPE